MRKKTNAEVFESFIKRPILNVSNVPESLYVENKTLISDGWKIAININKIIVLHPEKFQPSYYVTRHLNSLIQLLRNQKIDFEIYEGKLTLDWDKKIMNNYSSESNIEGV